MISTTQLENHQLDKNVFTVLLENDCLLNTVELVKFCQQHQGQEISLIVSNEGHCLTKTGVYDILNTFEFQFVKIKTFNLLESHHRYQIDNTSWNHWLYRTDSFDYSFDYTWNQKNIFGCFYGRPTAARLGIASHLARYHKEYSTVTVKFSFDDQDDRRRFDLDRLFYWHPDAIDHVNLLRAEEFRTDHSYKPGSYNQNNSLAHLYQDIFVDLVAEPIYEGTSFYPTEKIARAMLCRRPFIVMASKYYVHYLRQMGFKTFDQWWDESYDCYDSNIRYHKILKLIDQLASNKYQIEKYYHDMQQVLTHNYNLLTSRQFNQCIQQIKDPFEND